MMEVSPPETLSMLLRDGSRLEADVYRPAALGSYPVLLMRQPYGRRIASTVCYAHPAWYAAHGYIVVIQDVRGRGTSEGDFLLFEQEMEDGYEAVEWAAQLPGSTGAVGMYGFSYQGVTQLLAAAGHPPALKAIAPAMIGWDLRRDWAYENGAFPLAANIGWAVQLAAQSALRAGDTAAFAELSEAARGLPLGHVHAARPALLHRYAKYVPHYARWLDTDFDDPYWQRISPAAHARALALAGPPALFIGGWYDTHLPGTIAAYRAYEESGRADAELIVGPWAHFPWGSRLSGREFGDGAIGKIDQLQIQWFDRHLKGAPLGNGRPRVSLFDVGTTSWRGFDRWPDATSAWSIGSGGRAALDERDGRLSSAAFQGKARADYLVHDPWRPVGTVGGAFGMPCGPVDRTEADGRPDVLTYTTHEFDVALRLAGSPVAHLRVSADRPSFDISCILSRVDATGRAMHLTEGYFHLAGMASDEVRLTLRPLCATLRPGERLRLSIAAASFPAYPINPGTGQRPADASVDQAEVITLRLGLAESRLSLPVTHAEADA
ncbi:MAG: CocE/NonD family hydrolase [Novosphingobium sp.]